jgi:predicted  nucleic acid-binding Zn-ribbon protein
MPHQCLNCGKIFEEGSSKVLKGCPKCNGNRFFFTKKPLDEKEREAINDKASKDINSKILDILGIDKNDVIDKKGKWKKLKPSDVRKVLKPHLTDNINKKQTEDYKDYENSNDKKIDNIELKNRPETINIEKPGKYVIDIKGLLEEEPIIIQKDGTYTIHLPSIFKMLDKEDTN